MDIYQKASELKKANQAFVLVTVVKTTGSTPGKAGFKMIVDREGNSFGTVGGGAIEKEALSEAGRILQTGADSKLMEYLLDKDEKVVKDDVKVVPMSCRGKITLFYETEKASSTLYVFGGGHVGRALIEIAQNLRFSIVLIDNRNDILQTSRDKNINCVFSEYKAFAESFSPDEDSYYVILTYGHTFDYDILETLYRRKLVTKYAGVIASRSKAAEMIKSLKKDIGADVDLSLLHTPIGIKTGGDSAFEIALSIAAELQAVKYGKTIKSEK